jgi:hypothetical protein
MKLVHWINGNLAVIDNVRVILASSQSKQLGDCWKTLQGGGNMITRPGRPDDNPKT